MVKESAIMPQLYCQTSSLLNHHMRHQHLAYCLKQFNKIKLFLLNYFKKNAKQHDKKTDAIAAICVSMITLCLIFLYPPALYLAAQVFQILLTTFDGQFPKHLHQIAF